MYLRDIEIASIRPPGRAGPVFRLRANRIAGSVEKGTRHMEFPISSKNTQMKNKYLYDVNDRLRAHPRLPARTCRPGFCAYGQKRKKK